MAVKKKRSQEFGPDDAVVLRGIQEAVCALYTRNANEINRVRRESEVDQIKVTFGCDIDHTESVPSLKVSIRYSQTYTDNVVANIPDPSQPDLPFEFTSAEEAKRIAAETAGDAEQGGE